MLFLQGGPDWKKSRPPAYTAHVETQVSVQKPESLCNLKSVRGMRGPASLAFRICCIGFQFLPDVEAGPEHFFYEIGPINK